MLKSKSRQCGKGQMIFIEGVYRRGWYYEKISNGNSHISFINLEPRCHYPIRERRDKNPEGHRSPECQIRIKVWNGVDPVLFPWGRSPSCHEAFHMPTYTGPAPRGCTGFGEPALLLSFSRASPLAGILASWGPKEWVAWRAGSGNFFWVWYPLISTNCFPATSSFNNSFILEIETLS